MYCVMLAYVGWFVDICTVWVLRIFVSTYGYCVKSHIRVSMKVSCGVVVLFKQDVNDVLWYIMVNID